jgi:type IV secretion system protein VirD4
MMLQHNEPGRLNTKKMIEGDRSPTPTPDAATIQKQERAAERIKQIESRGAFDTCLIGFVVLAAFWLLLRWARGGRRTDGDSHGSARFANIKERRAMRRRADADLNAGELPLGIADKKHIYVLPIERTLRHVALLGGTGAGKSRAIFLPACYHAAHSGTSIIATDPKSELWNNTSGFHEHALRFAPREPDKSSCFNWIPLCTNPNLTKKFAATIVSAGAQQHTGDSFWTRAETDLIAAVFAFAAHTKTPTPTTAYKLLASDIKTLSAYLSGSSVDFVREKAQSFIEADDKVKTNIKLGAVNAFSFMADPDVQRMTSSSFEPPRFEVLRANAAAIYWCLDEADIEELQPLTSLFFIVALEQLKRSSERDQIPVQLLLDEFANVGKLKGLHVDITTLRSRGVAIVAGLQSRSQLDHVYGQTAAKIIWDNFTSKIVLAGLSHDTAEEISRALGETTVAKEQESRNARGEVTRSESTHQRRLMTADEVTRMHRDEAILISGNDRPLNFQKLFWKGISMTANPERCGETKFITPTPVAEALDRALAAEQPKKKKLPPPPPPPPTPTATAADPHADDDFDELDVMPPPPTPKPIPRALIPIRKKVKTCWDDFDEHTIYQVEKLPDPDAA